MISLAIPRIELGTRSEARTKEVDRALKMGADYILFLDSDQTMPDEGLELMMALDVDIAVIDTPPHDSTIHNATYNPDGTICYCTMACSLIKTSVFDKIDGPWFSSSYDFVKDDIWNGKYTMKRLDKSVDNNVGEDIFFIRKCIDAGLTIGIVPNLTCLHFKL